VYRLSDADVLRFHVLRFTLAISTSVCKMATVLRVTRPFAITSANCPSHETCSRGVCVFSLWRCVLHAGQDLCYSDV